MMVKNPSCTIHPSRINRLIQERLTFIGYAVPYILYTQHQSITLQKRHSPIGYAITHNIINQLFGTKET